jgi:hypothetical protein
MKKIENQMTVNIQEVDCQCAECGGRGLVLEMDGDGFEGFVTCANCDGTGYVRRLI